MNLFRLPMAIIGWLIQSFIQLTAKLVVALLGLIIVPIGLLKTRFPSTHPFRDYVEIDHTQKYIDRGSSGHWVYERLPDWKIMKPFDNLNYGLRGEHTGRFSALHDGKESTFRVKFIQAALRNPANGLRYTDFFSCQVDNCDIVWWGDEGPLDIQPELKPGWNFVKGTDRDTGRNYYGFKVVKGIGSSHAFQFRCGFKVEPSHIGRGDLPPRKERATFTFRINPYKAINPF